MSKAEERGYKAYPYNGDYRGQGDSNSKLREAYIKGYHQAEKDLKLTWEDIKRIYHLVNEVSDDLGVRAMYVNIYQEVLKRFKEIKDK